jgi:hypothetical protein
MKREIDNETLMIHLQNYMSQNHIKLVDYQLGESLINPSYLFKLCMSVIELQEQELTILRGEKQDYLNELRFRDH